MARPSKSRASLTRSNISPAVLESASDTIRGIIKSSGEGNWKGVRDHAEWLVKMARLLEASSAVSN